MSGISDAAARSTCGRVLAAFSGIGLSSPPGRAHIELKPPGLAREEGHYDLPIALGLLGAMGVLPREEMSWYAAIGGLEPDGSLTAVRGVLSAAVGASAMELGLIYAAEQGGEAAWAGGIEILAAADLLSLVAHFLGSQVLSQPRLPRLVSEPPRPQHSDVCLSSDARRSLMAAASSRRPILLVGEPDRCRSVVSCMPGLLPDLMLRESIEASMIHGLAGLLANGSLLRRPPFRVVDASATGAALFGDELRSYPGEIILAHHGVLVLEGLGAFSGATVLKILQALRGRAKSVHRSGSDATFPALFRLVATSTLEEVGRLTTFSDTDFLTEFDIICRAGQKGSRAVFR